MTAILWPFAASAASRDSASCRSSISRPHSRSKKAARSAGGRSSAARNSSSTLRQGFSDMARPNAAPPHLPLDPGLGQAQLPPHVRNRQAQRRGGFFGREAPEEA